MRGTCYVVLPQNGLGDNPANDSCTSGDCPPNRGTPGVAVNQLTQNVFINDTPIWYDPAIGPSIDVTLSYNSHDASNYNSLVGNKWSLNFGSHIGGGAQLYRQRGPRHAVFPTMASRSSSSREPRMPRGCPTLRRAGSTRVCFASAVTPTPPTSSLLPQASAASTACNRASIPACRCCWSRATAGDRS